MRAQPNRPGAATAPRVRLLHMRDDLRLLSLARAGSRRVAVCSLANLVKEFADSFCAPTAISYQLPGASKPHVGWW